MLWLLILKLWYLLESFLDYFVSIQVMFTKSTVDGQWNIAFLDGEVTPKGWAVLDAVVTIVHRGLDFVAQFVSLFPAPDGQWINTPTIH